MSLDKKICKKCCDRDGRAPWNKEDEQQWKRDETVTCPIGVHFASIKSKPPDYCLYVLEHLINIRE